MCCQKVSIQQSFKIELGDYCAKTLLAEPIGLIYLPPSAADVTFIFVREIRQTLKYAHFC